MSASVPRRVLAAVARRLRAARRLLATPPPGTLELGDLRRTTPVSEVFGFDRGTPVDRHYIEAFLARHVGLVRGRVLEVADRAYTERFGGEAVTHSDVLHVEPGAPGATVIADLTHAPGIADASYDCVILTQTLPFIRDVPAAVRELARILAPGGAVLATVPGIMQVSRYDADRWGDYWRFTPAGARLLFADAFGEGNVTVTAHGNVLSAVALLHGLAAEELTASELDAADDDYPVTIGIVARRP